MALLQRTSEQVVLPIGLPWLHVYLRLDPLAGFFLFIVGLVTCIASCYGPGYIQENIEENHNICPFDLFYGNICRSHVSRAAGS